ncbi:zinc ribbon domain-containing protein [Candidatus Pacearchaeota archaeon]|nr:zinc ribbon domain-containing protein [Candidatus Pacearchaeota archaeon]
MPLFEYECVQCGNKVEIIQSSSKPNPECEKCRGETRRLISKSSFRFKNGGWASDGYQKKT